MSGQTIPTPSIEHVINRNIYENHSTWGVAILDHTGDLGFEHDGHILFPAASFGKLSAVLAWRRNGGHDDDPIRFEESDIRPGNGILQYAPPGKKLEAHEVVRMALSFSDNTALRTLVRVSGGPKKVNEILLDEDSKDGLELQNTAFTLENWHDSAPEAAFLHGETTPLESARIFRHLLETDKLANEALCRSNYNGGLRGAISDHGAYRDQNKAYEQLRQAKDFKNLREFRFLESLFPGKEGTILDDEEHLRHHVARINNLVVSTMTTISPQEPRSVFGFGRGERHHIRKAQARIGQILLKARP